MKSIYISGVFILFGAIFSCKTKPPEACVAKPIIGCACTMQYDPVCGCDGKTYGNECEAGCAQIKVVSKGECKKLN